MLYIKVVYYLIYVYNIKLINFFVLVGGGRINIGFGFIGSKAYTFYDILV